MAKYMARIQATIV